MKNEITATTRREPMNENEFEIDGVKYRAEAETTCNGCAFNSERKTCVMFADGPDCCKRTRADNRNVIFVKVSP